MSMGAQSTRLQSRASARAIDPEQLSEVIGEIYEAALDARVWPAALERVADFVQGAAAMMFWQDALLAQGARYYSWGDDPHYTKRYFEEYIALNPLRTIQHLIPVGQVAAVSDVLPRDQMWHGPFYEEWMRPQGYIDNVLTNLDRSATSYASFAVARHERHGLVDAETRRRMALLAPHVRRAVLIGKLGDLHRTETEGWNTLLDGIGAGIFLITAEAKVLQSNQIARAMIAEADVVSLADFRLSTFDRRLQKDFRDFQALAATNDVRVGGTGIALPLQGKSGVDYAVHFLPLRAAPLRPRFDDPRAEAAVFIRRAEVDTRSGLQMLVQRYDFTPRETEVLQAIVELRGVPQVSALLGISSRTAKAHLHSIFAKTGTDRQADLIRLVAGFASPI